MNGSGDSNVVAFEIEDSSTKVKFGDGSIYLYTSGSAGVAILGRMKQLAKAGQGLNSFISKVVRKGYAAKLS